jgi:hypothetical protein
MDLKKIPRLQLESFYAVCQWVTRTLEQPVNIVSYMERTKKIYIQFGDREQLRAFYVSQDGAVSPNWND